MSNVMAASACNVFKPSRCNVRAASGPEINIDVPGSIMYLVCNRRRQIWALKPNIGGNPAFTILAQRGPLWPDVPGMRSVMSRIDGDSTGAWYVESPANSVHLNGPPHIVFNGLMTTPHIPVLHRLDAELNLVRSYVFRWSYFSSGVLNSASGLYPQTFSALGGGKSAIMGAFRRVAVGHGLSGSPPTIDLPGGLVSVGFNSLLNACTHTFQFGTSFGGWMQVGYNQFLQNQIVYPSINLVPADKAVTPIPLPNYQNMLDETNPNVGDCGGAPGTIYASSLTNPIYIARWSGGQLVAYKTPADSTLQDDYRAQSIGGSASVCYTTQNNDWITIRDGGLNAVRTFKGRADIDAFLGPVNPANGVSGYLFTGIGGR